ncbi:hypothetical protein F511_42650 [Dorcoceras hygrometricum]|uniref:Uncharacterized protein n=1 Tax=Dorcoceras hygrometricum TaxID=472368 RepID=A0A2Z7BFQ0_9LAMI|nr:hypothetical protein F511_42650 [Dorcoceras hygrometricum]
MSLFDLQDVCIAIGSLATLDLPMVVDLIGIYVLKGPYCTLTMTNWFLQALSVIPRGSWGDVARRFTMIRWAIASSREIPAASNNSKTHSQLDSQSQQRNDDVFTSSYRKVDPRLHLLLLNNQQILAHKSTSWYQTQHRNDVAPTNLNAVVLILNAITLTHLLITTRATRLHAKDSVSGISC